MLSDLSSTVVVSNPLPPPWASPGPTSKADTSFGVAVADAVEAQNADASIAETPVAATRPEVAIPDNGKQVPPPGMNLPPEHIAAVSSTLTLMPQDFSLPGQESPVGQDDEDVVAPFEELGPDSVMSLPFDTMAWTAVTPTPLPQPEVPMPLPVAPDSALAVVAQGSNEPGMVAVQLPTVVEQEATLAVPKWLAAVTSSPSGTAFADQLLQDAPDTLVTTATGETGATLDGSADARSEPDASPGLLFPAQALSQGDNPDELSDFALSVEIVNSPSEPSSTPDSSPASAVLGAPMPSGEVGKSTPLTLILDAEVGSEPWLRELGQQVVWQAGAEIQNARIRLNPEDLGPIEVEVRIVDSRTEVHFIAAHPSTREALEQGLGRLREQLDSAGLSLSAASVGDGHVGRDAEKGQDPHFGQPLTPWQANAIEGAELPQALIVRKGLIDEYA